MDTLAALMRRLNYQFDDKDLLVLALTHCSRGSENYERLEYLGDSILGFVVADWLYTKFPDLAEGKLSRMRSSLVRQETLALVARELQLGDYLILGEGELKSGGFNRDSILSDVVESLIGAIYLDNGYTQASQFIFTHFASHFSAISARSNFKDAKSQLQEAMQKGAMELPTYTIVDTSGVQHRQKFTIECALSDFPITARATARSRRLAEQQSAELVLQQFLELKSANASKRREQ